MNKVAVPENANIKIGMESKKGISSASGANHWLTASSLASNFIHRNVDVGKSAEKERIPA